MCFSIYTALEALKVTIFRCRYTNELGKFCFVLRKTTLRKCKGKKAVEI